jgi:putative peptidoglycan binding protein
MKFVLGAVLVLVAAPAFCAQRKSPAKAHAKAAAQPVTKTAHKSARSTGAKSSARSGSRSHTAARASSNAHGRRRARYAVRAHRPPAPTYQLQPTPDRYKEIQQALADRGYFSGAVDGQWGSDSVDALKRFQMEHNAGTDGKINSLSLIQLGLGPARDHLENVAEPPGTSAFAPGASVPPPPVAAAVSNSTAPSTEEPPPPLSQQ